MFTSEDTYRSEVVAGANRRRLRSELRPHPKEEAMSYALATVLRDGRRSSATRERRAGTGWRGTLWPWLRLTDQHEA